jgi:hypothetical protein
MLELKLIASLAEAAVVSMKYFRRSSIAEYDFRVLGPTWRRFNGCVVVTERSVLRAHK